MSVGLAGGVTALLLFYFMLPTPASAARVVVADVVQVVNAARSEAFLPPLIVSQKLTIAALSKGLDMYLNAYLEHTSPQGRTPWSFIEATGYQYRSVGENLGYAPVDTASLVSSMLNSAPHRANILSRSHTDIGLAVVPHPKLPGQVLVVMLFAAPSQY
jgi:uncharacterized protein YkwD